MLSSVLRSRLAFEVNIEIMRAFVRLRRTLSKHADLARKLEALEKKYDIHFNVVFDAIRALMAPREPEACLQGRRDPRHPGARWPLRSEDDNALRRVH